MKWKMGFIGVWIALFVATLIVRGYFGAPRRSMASHSGESENERLLEELRSKPRKTIMFDEKLLREPRMMAFDSELSAFVRAHAQGLRSCKELVMRRSTRPHE